VVVLERSLHCAPPMTRLHSLGWVSITLGLLSGCGRAAAPPPRIEPPEPSAPVASDYVTINPEVSVSRSAEPFEPTQPELDAQADVMAEILALPPGR